MYFRTSSLVARLPRTAAPQELWLDPLDPNEKGRIISDIIYSLIPYQEQVNQGGSWLLRASRDFKALWGLKC